MSTIVALAIYVVRQRSESNGSIAAFMRRAVRR